MTNKVNLVYQFHLIDRGYAEKYDGILGQKHKLNISSIRTWNTSAMYLPTRVQWFWTINTLPNTQATPSNSQRHFWSQLRGWGCATPGGHTQCYSPYCPKHRPNTTWTRISTTLKLVSTWTQVFSRVTSNVSSVFLTSSLQAPAVACNVGEGVKVEKRLHSHYRLLSSWT